MANTWDEAASRALFRDVVEPLADRFEPALCDEYVQLFAPIVEGVFPDLSAAELIARYERVRRARQVSQQPRRVFVLSRVTLGADVAVTSIVLDAAKRRWPDAEVVFVGAAKNYDLFAADPRVKHKPDSISARAERCATASPFAINSLWPSRTVSSSIPIRV